MDSSILFRGSLPPFLLWRQKQIKMFHTVLLWGLNTLNWGNTLNWLNTLDYIWSDRTILTCPIYINHCYYIDVVFVNHPYWRQPGCCYCFFYVRKSKRERQKERGRQEGRERERGGEREGMKERERASSGLCYVTQWIVWWHSETTVFSDLPEKEGHSFIFLVES